MKRLLTVIIITCVFGVTTVNAQIIELGLVLDSSGSISTSNYSLQLNAYKNIFNDSFYSTYVNPADTLYVAGYQFATGVTQRIGFTLIDSDTAAATFGDQFSATLFPKTSLGNSTNTAGAIALAGDDLNNNSIDGFKMIIDISTDGVPTANSTSYPGTNSQAAIAAAADYYMDGVNTNVIGVGGVDSVFIESLVNAGGGFSSYATDFNAFEAALRTKISREINGVVPEPSTFLLLGSGLAGLFFYGRKRKKS